MWKMLHMLYTLRPGRSGLRGSELADAGIDCGPDTLTPLEESGAVVRTGDLYALTEPARRILGTCVVANRRWPSDDMRVDDPSAFVVMPFSEPWSDQVYRELIEPGITAAGLECIRGDLVVRVGDLGQNIWGALLHAGIVVADVSALNANVFYELGLAHALGKDTVILKQNDARVPADIGGAHYHQYELRDLDAGARWLRAELEQWAAKQRSAVVRALRTQ
jgi:hypothetical protein